MAEVRAAHRREVAPIAHMLARAFLEDPVSVAFFPDPARRPAHLRRFFAAQLIHHYLPRGEVATSDSLESAALWMPPRPRPARLADRVALGATALSFGRAYPLAQRLGAVLARRHPRVPHYYLGILGTDPVHQRHGHASALLAPMLERCDTEGALAYLECSLEANLAFYARFGFAVREEVLVTRTGPRLWLMERRAR